MSLLQLPVIDGVGARSLDLRDVRREVLHLLQRVKLVADDLDVGALLGQHLARRRGDGLAERVILVDEIDGLDLLILRDDVGHRRHFHVGVGVEAEMPEIALLVGERRIDGRIVQEQHFLARIALVVLLDRLGDGERDGAAVALDDEARAVVQRLLQLDQRFLRIDLVVEREKLDLLAVDPARRIDRVDVELMRLLGENAGAGGAAGQRIDEGDLHIRDRRSGAQGSGEGQPNDPARASIHASSCFVVCPRVVARGGVRRFASHRNRMRPPKLEMLMARLAHYKQRWNSNQPSILHCIIFGFIPASSAEPLGLTRRQRPCSA